MAVQPTPTPVKINGNYNFVVDPNSHNVIYNMQSGENLSVFLSKYAESQKLTSSGDEITDQEWAKTFNILKTRHKYGVGEITFTEKDMKDLMSAMGMSKPKISALNSADVKKLLADMSAESDFTKDYEEFISNKKVAGHQFTNQKVFTREGHPDDVYISFKSKSEPGITYVRSYDKYSGELYSDTTIREDGSSITITDSEQNRIIEKNANNKVLSDRSDFDVPEKTIYEEDGSSTCYSYDDSGKIISTFKRTTMHDESGLRTHTISKNSYDLAYDDYNFIKNTETWYATDGKTIGNKSEYDSDGKRIKYTTCKYTEGLSRLVSKSIFNFITEDIKTINYNIGEFGAPYNEVKLSNMKTGEILSDKEYFYTKDGKHITEVSTYDPNNSKKMLRSLHNYYKKDGNTLDARAVFYGNSKRKHITYYEKDGKTIDTRRTWWGNSWAPFVADLIKSE